MKSIIVVINKELKDHGRVLCHSLCKNQDIKAALWSLNHYTAQEKAVSGKNYFIFLGENEVTKSLTPLVDNWVEEQGVKIGYNYRKAFIQQFDKPTNIELLNAAVTEYLMEIWISIAMLLINITLIGPSGRSTFPTALSIRILKRWKDRKNTTMNQYTFGIQKFLESMLEGFLSG